MARWGKIPLINRSFYGAIRWGPQFVSESSALARRQVINQSSITSLFLWEYYYAPFANSIASRNYFACERCSHEANNKSFVGRKFRWWEKTNIPNRMLAKVKWMSFACGVSKSTSSMCWAMNGAFFLFRSNERRRLQSLRRMINFTMSAIA